MDNTERFWAKVDKSGECWEWTAGLRRGYGRFRYSTQIALPAHRYSYILHHPLTIDLIKHLDMFVCHKCDNRKCVNPAHLFLGSQGDNMRDCVSKGRGVDNRGENQGCSKLTETQVREIRTKYANGGVLQRELALEYGVSSPTISLIISRRNWSHI